MSKKKQSDVEDWPLLTSDAETEDAQALAVIEQVEEPEAALALEQQEGEAIQGEREAVAGLVLVVIADKAVRMGECVYQPNEMVCVSPETAATLKKHNFIK